MPPRAPHVAVLAFPFGTHAAPLANVAHRMAATSPDAEFSFFSTSLSNSTIFSKAETRENVTSYDITDGVPRDHVFGTRPQERIDMFLGSADVAFREGIDRAVSVKGRSVTCLVGDAFMWFGADVARDLGVPWVPFWTAGPTALTSHLYTDDIRSEFSRDADSGHKDKNLKSIPGLSDVRIADLPQGVVCGDLESMFSKMLHNMSQKLPHAAAVFINSFEELDLIVSNDLKSKLKNYLNIGPLNLIREPSLTVSDPYECMPWLEKHEDASVVYISFGSTIAPPQNEIVAITEALQAKDLPFLWSLRDDAKAHFPQGFLKTKGKIVSWAPQFEILSHRSIGAFITHCGWNSVLESLSCGVPMICRPFFGDQQLNARMVECVWKIGVGVESEVFTKNGLIKSLDIVLTQTQGQNPRERIKELKGLAVNAVGPNGSSTVNFKTLLEIVLAQKDTA